MNHGTTALAALALLSIGCVAEVGDGDDYAVLESHLSASVDFECGDSVVSLSTGSSSGNCGTVLLGFSQGVPRFGHDCSDDLGNSASFECRGGNVYNQQASGAGSLQIRTTGNSCQPNHYGHRNADCNSTNWF